MRQSKICVVTTMLLYLKLIVVNVCLIRTASFRPWVRNDITLLVRPRISGVSMTVSGMPVGDMSKTECTGLDWKMLLDMVK